MRRANHCSSRWKPRPTRHPALLALALALTASAMAHAAPLSGGRPGGLVLDGPATDHLAATILNPAALGLLRDSTVYFSATGDLQLGSAQRTPIDRSSGRALATPAALDQAGDRALRFAPEPWRRLTPQLFAAISSPLGSSSVVFGLSTRWQRDQASLLITDADPAVIDGALQSASRYHGAALSLTQLHITPAAAVRLFRGWWLGLSVSYIRSSVDLGLVRDAALIGGGQREGDEPLALDACGAGADAPRCDFEAPLAAEGIHVSGSTDALGAAIGLVGRLRADLDAGIAYVSAVGNPGSNDLRATGDATLYPASAVRDGVREALGLNAETTPILRGRSVINFRLPDILSVGARWRATTRVALEALVRWTRWGRHTRLDVRFSGVQLRLADRFTADRLILHRGFRDVVALQLGSALKLHPSLELQLAAQAASSAVDRSAVTALTIDGWNLDAFAALQWALQEGLKLRLGYGLLWMPPITTASSSFDPGLQTACADSGLDIERPECQATGEGRGVATSAGRYQRIGHRFDLGLSFAWH
ncbi:MAG: outer membrane protein transport protein [Proteobacteria bacterium]|nr:outer membrane protein transport protein [Pseudomonadota bacterium]